MSWQLSAFEPYRDMVGIYAFFDEQDCIYVGQASCIYSRVKSHKGRFRSYARFTAYPCAAYVQNMDLKNTRAFLNLMEAYFICKFEPIENVSRPDFYGKMMASWQTRAAFDKAAEITKCFGRIAPPLSALD